jgi:hypothetical protein
MKRFSLLWLLTAIIALTAKADIEVSVSDLLYSINTSDNTARLTLGRAFAGDLEIPSEIEHDGIKYNVTAIGNDAFSYSSSLLSVKIPNTITEIGDGAFHSCEQLADVDIASSVTKIGIAAFAGCKKLTHISLPESVVEIGRSIFEGCSSLETVKLNDNIKVIPAAAFCFCDQLKEIKLPTSLIELSPNELYMNGAFQECTSLTEIELPGTLKIIGDKAFQHTGLTSITIPESVTEIGRGALSYCQSLESAILPEGLKILHDGLFAYCQALKSIKIPDSVEGIGSDYLYNLVGVFQQCRNLEKATLGTSLKTIKPHSFSGCNKLGAIDFPASLDSIHHSAFANCALTTVNIGKDVSYIGENAFYNCPITSFTIDPTNTHLAFDGKILYNYDKTVLIDFIGNTDDITELFIPSAITKIPVYILTDLTNLTAINVAQGNETYTSHNGILYNHDMTTLLRCPRGYTGHFKLPETVTDINDYGFKECTHLSGIDLGDNLQSIGMEAFSGCQFTGIILGENINTLHNKAFARCNRLKEIIIPSSITTIEPGTFQYCDSLSYVKLPDNLKTIGHNAFQGCSGLTNISIPESVTEIGFDAFGECVNLKSVYIYNPVPPQISGSLVPYEISSQCILYVPNGSESTYASTYSYFQLKIKPINPTDEKLVYHATLPQTNEEWNFTSICCGLTENIDNNETYTLTLRIKGSEKNIETLIQIFGLTDRWFSITDQWETYTIVFNGKDSSRSRATKGFLNIFLFNYSGDIFISNATLIPSSSSDNIVYNSDFSELGMDGWSISNSSGDNISAELIPDDTTTAITELPAVTSTETYSVYGLDGQMIMHTTDRSQLTTLRPGIYIVNGKKILVK